MTSEIVFFRQLRQRTGEQACKLDLGVALYPLFTHYLKSQVVSLLSHLFIIYEAFLDGFFPWGYHSPGHFSASCALQNSFWRLPWSVAHLRCAKACKHHRPSAGIGIGVLIFHITPILGIWSPTDTWKWCSTNPQAMGHWTNPPRAEVLWLPTGDSSGVQTTNRPWTIAPLDGA